VKNSARPLPDDPRPKVRDFMDDQDGDFLDWDAERAAAVAAHGQRSDAAFPFGDNAGADPTVEPRSNPSTATAPRKARTAKSRSIRILIAAAVAAVWIIAAIAFFVGSRQQSSPAELAPLSEIAADPAALPAVQAPVVPAPVQPPIVQKPVATTPKPQAASVPRAIPAAEIVRPRARPSARAAHNVQAERPRQNRRRQPPRNTAATQAVAPVRADTVTCILPSGQDVGMSQAACRARSGVVYR